MQALRRVQGTHRWTVAFEDIVAADVLLLVGTNITEANPITGLKVKEVRAGGAFTCALLTNRTMKCWGWGPHGELGYGDTDARGDNAGEMGNVLPAVQLGTGRRARAISAGAFHTCALLDNGTVKCWGRDDYVSALNTTSPVAVAGIANATAVAVAPDFTCALLANGTALCLGLNSEGELGNGTTVDATAAHMSPEAA